MITEDLYRKGRYLIGFVTLLILLFFGVLMYWSNHLFTTLEHYSNTSTLALKMDKSRLSELIYTRDNDGKSAQNTELEIGRLIKYLKQMDGSVNKEVNRDAYARFYSQIILYRDKFSEFAEYRKVASETRHVMSSHEIDAKASIELLRNYQVKYVAQVDKEINRLQVRLSEVTANTSTANNIIIESLNFRVSQQGLSTMLTMQGVEALIRTLDEISFLGFALQHRVIDSDSIQLLQELDKAYEVTKSSLDLIDSALERGLTLDETSPLFVRLNHATERLIKAAYKLRNNHDLVLDNIQDKLNRKQLESSELVQLLTEIERLADQFEQISQQEKRYAQIKATDVKQVYSESVIKRVTGIVNQADNLGNKLSNINDIKAFSYFIPSVERYLTEFKNLVETEVRTIEAGTEMNTAIVLADQILQIYLTERVEELVSLREMASYVIYIIIVFSVVMLWLMVIIRRSQYNLKSLNVNLRKAKEEAEEKHQLVSTLFNSLPDIIFVKDKESRYIDANNQFAALVGKEADKVRGLDDFDLFDEETASKIQEDDKQVIRTLTTKHFETWVPDSTLNKELVPFDIIQAPLLNADSTLRGTMGIARNVSQRKAQEAQLERSMQIAEDANRAKSDFLANMSHEIRTPMNAILGMSHLTLETELSVKQRNYVEKLHRSAESLLGIINDILDFSKIEAGKMDLEAVDFRLEDVFDQLANIVGLRAEEKALEFHFDIPASLPTSLVGDPLRLGQILTNLGNNAVKFTDKGGEVVIKVSVVAEDGDNIHLRFEVKDTGIGMTQEQMSRLFQSFSQADSSTTRKYGGTGLGLTISKNLVEMMSGKIGCESQQGVGSNFHFVVPLQKQNQQSYIKEELAAELDSLKVLVVDDNETSRQIFTQLLDSFGFYSQSVASGEEALKVLSEAEIKSPFDLVLVDWDMPGMDGVETIHAIHNYNELAAKPELILMTAHAKESLSEIAQELGIGGFITKPATPSTLLDSILVAMGKEVIAEHKEQLTSSSLLEAKSTLNGATVLLVEDNQINQELAEELLSGNGIKVIIANDGQEALDALENEKFDGILMDCQMPVMDGYTATREIRKNPGYKALPIIAMTANALVGDKEKVLEAGMNDHISKPIDIENMFKTMAKWIKPDTASDAVAGEASAEEFEDFPTVYGIDSRKGLKRTQNNINLYRKLLKHFLESNKTFVSDFNDARNQFEDSEAVVRIAHTLKGTAGTVGADKIYLAAEGLELAAKNSNDDLDEYLIKVITELKPTLKDLERALTEKESASSVDFDRKKVMQLLSTIREQILEYSTDASSTAEALAELVKYTAFAEVFSDVLKSVHMYDFDGALEALDQFETALQADKE